MAGGIGSRLWPFSRKDYPKQFLPLAADNSMLQETITRLEGAGYSAPSIICNQNHRFLVAEHARSANMLIDRIILESQSRGTAFTAAIAALCALEKSPEALALLLPCDHYIERPAMLHEAISQAAPLARSGALVMFGVPPTAPKTGYGYIKTGMDNAVLEFTEKPDEATAAHYIAQGNYLWNAGIFLFPARRILEDLKALAPQTLIAAEESWAGAKSDLDFFRLPEQPVKDCPDISIDYAVLEKADNACIIPLQTRWSDIGSWQSLWNQMDKDPQGNASHGETVLEDVHNCLFYGAEGMTITALGTKDLAILADEDAILVADLSKTEHVPKIIKKLAETGSTKHRHHRQVWRPWGSYKILGSGERYILKRLSINPGAAISLQYHNHRAEHWVVVKGTVQVRKGESVQTLTADQSIYIPLGVHHRLENHEQESAELIEVQTGNYLDEDDIVRLSNPPK